jgi:hypothetical protein
MSLTYDKDPLSILENSQDTETTKWLVLTSKETNSTCGNMITSVIALVLGLVVQK